jgi:hypothetical protein
MATLITKNSQTSSSVPSAGSLSTGELAVNTADAKLFTKHSDGSVKEIGSSFPSGTVMLFVQTNAPTGWTKSTTHDNKTLRVVSGTASSGGSSGFTTVFTNQTPTINTSGLSAGATTLSTAQMPSHTHTQKYGSTDGGTFNIFANVGNGDNLSAGQTASTGGGGSHSHSMSGSATSSAITLNVAYVDVIIATKN